MATTALEIDGRRLKIMTTSEYVSKTDDKNEVKLFTKVTLYSCDLDFMPMDVGAVTIHENDEENYHRELRAVAHQAGHFIPSQSTDYKWNPDYNPAEDTNDGSETAL
jgi:hypothetical protein